MPHAGEIEAVSRVSKFSVSSDFILAWWVVANWSRVESMAVRKAAKSAKVRLARAVFLVNFQTRSMRFKLGEYGGR